MAILLPSGDHIGKPILTFGSVSKVICREIPLYQVEDPDIAVPTVVGKVCKLLACGRGIRGLHLACLVC